MFKIIFSAVFGRLIGTQVPGKPSSACRSAIFYTRTPRTRVRNCNSKRPLHPPPARQNRRPAILNYLPTRSSESSLYGHRFDQTRDKEIRKTRPRRIRNGETGTPGECRVTFLPSEHDPSPLKRVTRKEEESQKRRIGNDTRSYTSLPFPTHEETYLAMYKQS